MAKKDAATASSTDGGGRLSKRSTRAILITAPIIALAVILGVLLGRKKGPTDTTGTGGGGGAGDNNDKPTDVFIKSPGKTTSSPSSMPSWVSTLAPTPFTCPLLDVNKKFVVINSSRTRRQRHHRRWLQWQQQQHQRSLSSTYSTWFVKDVCSGDVILSCNMPCPSSAVARTSSSKQIIIGYTLTSFTIIDGSFYEKISMFGSNDFIIKPFRF